MSNKKEKLETKKALAYSFSRTGYLGIQELEIPKHIILNKGGYRFGKKP